MIKILSTIFVLLLIIPFQSAIAEVHLNHESLADNYKTKAKIKKLVEQPIWLQLLHAHSNVFNHFKSQAKSSSFFLAKTGNTDPAAELMADVAALFSDTLDESHMLCRFPARAHWLIEQLGIDAEELPRPECKSFNHFFSEINPEGATLIFPVAYLNSPSSMFGHTFLRIDQVGQTETTRLVAWSINYAASPNTKDGEILFAWKGLFGGYPGDFSVLPYYLKVHEYNDWESRDVWEFKLNLTQAETEQLVRHTWELLHIEFAYYFLKENCSYRVLELLDAVRPDNNFQAQFNHWAIPVDTVRAVESAGMVKEATFRPSAMKLVRNGLDQLSNQEKKLAYNLATAEDNSKILNSSFDAVSKMPIERQKAVEEVAYEYLRLKVQLDKLTRKQTSRRSLMLLRLRSELTAGSPLVPVKPPEVRDDQAHNSERVSLALGESRSSFYTELGWRPAFHALTDPFEGFPVGAQIKFFDAKLRSWEKNAVETTELERVDVITVTALTQHDRFFQPWSWQVNIGARRKEIPDKDASRPPVGFFDFSGGLNKAIFERTSFYMLLGGATEFAHSMARGFDVGPLAEMGLLGSYPKGFWHTSGQWQFSAKRIDWCNDIHSKQHIFELTNSFNLERNLALQLKINRDFRFKNWNNDASLGVLFFY